MARDFGWLSLSDFERRALPEAAEMFEIEQRLDRLSEEREHRLESLATTKSKDLHSIASKLAVAARVLLHEGGPAHRLVDDAAQAVATQHCPHCGAPYVAGAPRG
jgi:formate dehydrogenase maturation protein FdhE